jgi:hypothetical protein
MLLVPLAPFMPSSWRAPAPLAASGLGLLVKAGCFGEGSFRRG